MNGDPRPLTSDELDELLTAAIDDELTDAARDLGLSLDDAAAVVADPAVGSRRAALERARDVSAAHAWPLLDELEIERLVHATHAAPRRPAASPSRVRWLSLAAALVLVLGGAGVAWRVASQSDSTDRTADSAKETAATPGAGDTSAASGAEDLGAVDGPGALARALVASGELGDDANQLPRESRPSPTQPRSTVTSPAAYDVNSDCLARLPGPPGLHDVVLVGRALVKGEAAAVAKGIAGKDVVAWAFDPRTCAVLITFSASVPSTSAPGPAG